MLKFLGEVGRYVVRCFIFFDFEDGYGFLKEFRVIFVRLLGNDCILNRNRVWDLFFVVGCLEVKRVCFKNIFVLFFRCLLLVVRFMEF